MHYRDPQASKAHVLFFYRNFMGNGTQFCHVGLGVNSLMMCKCLRREGVHCDPIGVWSAFPVSGKPAKQSLDYWLTQTPGCTHAVIQAPWVSPKDLLALMHAHPTVHFIVRVHSQIGFLQVEPGAIAIVRDLLVLQEGYLNLTLSGNNRRICEFLGKAYSGKCLYLPNLYDISVAIARRWKDHTTRDKLRISSFGAIRLLKNHTTACAAAMLIAKAMKCDLEFWMSVNREEHGKGVLNAVSNMLSGLSWAKFVQNPWQDWASFRRTVESMDLCMQLSATETYNITSADACANAVPCVVSDCVEWAPRSWMTPIDDASAAARVGMWMLQDPSAGVEGQEHLLRNNLEGVRIWMRYLNSNPT